MPCPCIPRLLTCLIATLASGGAAGAAEPTAGVLDGEAVLVDLAAFADSHVAAPGVRHNWQSAPWTRTFISTSHRDPQTNPYNGSWLEYVIEVTTPGDYHVWMRIELNQDELKHLYLNGKKVGVIRQQSREYKNQNRFLQADSPVHFPKGRHTLRVAADQIVGWIDPMQAMYLTPDEEDPNAFQVSVIGRSLPVHEPQPSIDWQQTWQEQSLTEQPAAQLYPDSQPVAQAEADFVLVAGPSDAAPIVVDDPNLRFLGTELSDYVAKATGARPDLVATAPDRPYLELRRATEAEKARHSVLHDPEGFVIRVTPQRISVIGDTQRSIVYGSYAFLEQFVGVRWLLPHTEHGEYVPERTDLAYKTITMEEKPSFELRAFFYTYSDQIGREHHRAFEAWRLRQGMNSIKGRPGIGTSYTRAGGHIYHRLINGNKHFDERPELYALLDSERTKTRHVGVQICTTEPAVIDMAAEYMANHFRANPDNRFFVFAPNDGMGFCECDNCRDLDDPDAPGSARYSNRVTRFTSDVSYAIRRRYGDEFDDRYIFNRSYAYFLAPPTDPDIELGHNVGVEFTHWYCRSHALHDTSCPINELYQQNFADWSELNPRAVIGYEYFNKNIWLDILNPFHQLMLQDLTLYHANDYRGLLSQTGMNWGGSGMNFYLAAKSLWNVDHEPDVLIDDYLLASFGPDAALSMKNFYALLAAGVENSTAHTIGMWGDAAAFMPPSLMELAGQYLDQAGEALHEDTSARWRWERVKQTFDYTQDMLTLNRLLLEGRQASQIYRDTRQRVVEFITTTGHDYVIEPANVIRRFEQIFGSVEEGD